MPDNDVIFIHRGRNQKSREIGRLFTNIDYNFDYRGSSKFILLLKALLTSTEIPKAEVYFVEGGLCLNVAYFLKLWRTKKAKVILMVPEPLFYFDNLSKIKRWYIKKMLKKVDRIIAISDMVKKDAEKYYNGPIYVAHHYIIDIPRFLRLKIKKNHKRIIYVIERPKETGHIKGLDIVIDVFRILRNTHSDAELLLVGSGTEYLDYGIEGIKYLGFQKLEDILPECSIILSPSRYDAFNLAVAEGACAGLIPIVSNKTGAKEFIQKIDRSLVINSLNPIDYANKIDEIWTMRDVEIDRISISCKNQASHFSKNECFEEFKKAWRRW